MMFFTSQASQLRGRLGRDQSRGTSENSKNTHMLIHPVAQLRADDGREEEADAEPNVDKAVDADAEAVGRGEKACAKVSKGSSRGERE